MCFGFELWGRWPAKMEMIARNRKNLFCILSVGLLSKTLQNRWFWWTVSSLMILKIWVVWFNSLLEFFFLVKRFCISTMWFYCPFGTGRKVGGYERWIGYNWYFKRSIKFGHLTKSFTAGFSFFVFRGCHTPILVPASQHRPIWQYLPRWMRILVQKLCTLYAFHT